MARAASFPTPLAASALQMFLMTAASGMAREDDASVARSLYAKIAGLELHDGETGADVGIFCDTRWRAAVARLRRDAHSYSGHFLKEGRP